MLAHPRTEAGAMSGQGMGSGAEDLRETKENCPHMAVFLA